MTQESFFYILAAMAGIAIGMSTCNLLHAVYCEEYTYNFTKQEKDELFVSQMCVAGVELNVTNISECKYIYGGINSPYGEAIESAKP